MSDAEENEFPFYGWYSKQMEMRVKEMNWLRNSTMQDGDIPSPVDGYSYYDGPSGPVMVTCVTQDMDHSAKWDDIVYVGRVGTWPIQPPKSEASNDD